MLEFAVPRAHGQVTRPVFSLLAVSGEDSFVVCGEGCGEDCVVSLISHSTCGFRTYMVRTPASISTGSCNGNAILNQSN